MLLRQEVTNTPTRTALSNSIKSSLGEVTFKNWIIPDNELARVLVQELGNRIGKHRWHPAGSPDYVVIVSEGDTFYGRSFPTLISNALVEANTSCAASNVMVFSYLRGLEGIKPQPAKDIKGDGTPGTAEETTAALLRRRSEAGEERKAEGEAQKDYAWRLARLLKEKDAELRRNHRGRIAGVGLVGNDVYDKLVLLHALRPGLPEALFFTTDLDARLWSSPEELEYTKNLLVASAYDTRPSGGEAHPPFRDVYQTAVYRACRAAVRKAIWSTDVSPVLETNLFEIGRRGPVSLETESRREPSDCWNLAGWLLVGLMAPLGLFLLLACLLGGFSSSNPEDSYSLRLRDEGKFTRFDLCLTVVLVAWCVLGVGGAYLVAHLPDEEPWGFANGISIWPTELIRHLALGYGVMILVVANRRFHRHVRALREEFFASSAFSVDDFVDLASLANKLKQPSRPVDTWLAGQLRSAAKTALAAYQGQGSDPTPLRESLLLDLNELLRGSSIYELQRFNGVRLRPGTKKLRSQNPQEDHLARLNRLLFEDAYPLELSRKPSSIRIGRWVPPAHGKTGQETVDAAKLFSDYEYLGTCCRRFWRILLYVIGYVLVGGLVAWQTGGLPDRLCIRGTLSYWLDTGLLFLTILLFLLVLFYALDAARLTGTMLRYLAACASEWPEALTKKWTRRKGVRADHLDGWLDVRFAALKTRETGSFMKFPFILFLLLLISRCEFFENWTWPAVLGVVFGVNFILAAFCWWLVRNAARNVRKLALARVEEASNEVKVSSNAVVVADPETGVGVPFRIYLKRLRNLRKDIEGERGGAFSRWIQDPTLIALLIPTGVTGILSLLLHFLLNR
jgi:hypothetical protein